MNPRTASIPDRLAAIGAERPDAIAVIDGARDISFSALSLCVDRLAGWLDREGLAAGTVLGITVQNNFLHLVTSLALMRIGCVQLTLSLRDPPGIRQALADRCQVSVALTTEETDSVAGIRALRPDFAAIFADPMSTARHLPAPDVDATMMLCASSGTTGRPKIMPISQAQLVDRANTWKIGAPGKVVWRALPLDIDVSKRESIVALLGGATILLTTPRDTGDIVRLSQAHAVEILLLSPSQAQDLVASAGRAKTRLLSDRTVVQISGGAVSAAFCRTAQRLLTPKIEIRYGATECGTSTEGGTDIFDIDENAVGYLLPGISVEAVDEEDRPLPAGTRGRLRLRAPGMLSGYFDDAEQSALAFRDGWFYPGDVGRVTEDGLMIYEGRADDMMVLDSLNIFPAEIERVVEIFPGVIECAAFARKSPVHGDIPVLAIVAGDEFDQRALQDHCRRQLGVRSPRKILKVAKLPRNASGKILRRELSALLSS